MTVSSVAFYSQQYATAVELLAQQLRPRIASTFMPMSAVGIAATVVDFIDSFEADERTSLYDQITFGDAPHIRPWVYPRNFDKALPFDSLEQMQMNANPESSYVAGIVAALNRKRDDEAIRAFFDSRTVNSSSGAQTTDTFDTSAAHTVSVDTGGTGSGINVEKLQTGLQIARQLEVGVDQEEQFNCVISPNQERLLMNEIEVISSDFTVKRIMDAGTMVGSGYMKINWILSNRLLLDGSGYLRVPFYTSAGMSFCEWDGGIKTNVTQRTDIRGQPWQAYGKESVGAVRRDHKRVFEIKCAGG